MILYFKVGNFKSIYEKIVLNFNATSLSDYNDSNVIELNKKSILKSILLYGHNASGKSKILESIDFFKWFVSNSATEKLEDSRLDLEPFRLLENSNKEPSFFEMSFFIGKTVYRYGFEADDKKVYKEWLLEVKKTTEKPIFLRINNEFKIEYKIFENSEGLDVRTRNNALFISVASQWNVKVAQKIVDYIYSIISVQGLNDREYRDITIDLLKNNSYTELIQKFIQKADLGINGINVIDVPITYENLEKSIPEGLREIFKEQFEKRKPTTLISEHKVFDKDNNFVRMEPFLFQKSESEGTKKYFNLIGLIIIAIKENRPIIIDEFDAKLHSLLSKAILKLFNSNKIRTTSQLLVACHDTSLIDRNILRRDQIYFVEKDYKGSTNIITLAEYKPRKESPFDKNYLDGKYGGIPIIDDLESIF